MTLSELISGDLLDSKSLKAISAETETDTSDVKRVITSAVPILLQGMVQNSQTKSGAASLEKALDEHASVDVGKTLTTYLKKVDTADGSKIVKKILGDNTTDITKGLSKQTKVSTTNIKKILATVAPLILSLLGYEKASTNTSSGGLASLISSFLGGSSLNNSSISIGNIASALLGSSNSSSGNSTASLITTLLGGGSSSSSSGGDLAGTLLSSLLDTGSGSSSSNSSSLLTSLLGGSSSSSSSSSKKDDDVDVLSLITSLLTGN